MASFCFQGVPLFLDSKSAVELYKATQSVSSDTVAFALRSRRHDLTMQGQCSPGGRTLCYDIRDPDSGPGSAPAGRGTLDKCLRSWAFLFSLIKQQGWNWRGIFPMIPSGSKIVC